MNAQARKVRHLRVNANAAVKWLSFDAPSVYRDLQPATGIPPFIEVHFVAHNPGQYDFGFDVLYEKHCKRFL